MRNPQSNGYAAPSALRNISSCPAKAGPSPAHAELSFGNGMVMLGSVKKSEFDRLMKQPDEIGGAETETPYVIVSDADALYARAKAAGAKIVLDIKDEDYGGRGFSCRDLEGRLWNFGTYDPWGT
jgi:uncharacterized glyoxalase superfamily protein PhnB